jgi:nitrogen fixation protein FixH
MIAIRAEKEFTGRHMAIITCMFFAVVIAVNILMAYLANRTWSGLVVPNSYVASQQFNELSDQKRSMAAVGIHPHILYSDGKLVVEFQSAKSVHISKVVLTLGRLATDSLNQDFQLAEVGGDRFAVAASLGRGIWRGELQATLNGTMIWKKDVRFEAGN